MEFQVREYPKGFVPSPTDRGYLVSEHTTWKDACDKAEKLDAEGRRVFVCRASEATPKQV